MYGVISDISCSCKDWLQCPESKSKQAYHQYNILAETSEMILIQLMKKHAPEIAEKLESTNAASEEPAATQHANETGGITDAVKRHKVA